MIGWGIRVLLIHLLEQGLSKSAIAERLGMDRRTIHRWIASGELEVDAATGMLPRPVRRSSGARKLDGFLQLIATRLKDFPELTSVRLLAEIRAAGYTGGYTQLKEHVRRTRPAVEPEPEQRFETEPGVQGQVDFATVRTPWGTRYALLVVLGYSRLLWLRFFPRQDMLTLMAGLEEAFAYFGGVPKELLFDQMRSVITADLRDQGDRLVENAEFLRFAAHWGFRVRACRPYRARTKGKVERPIRYLRGNFLYARDFLGDEDLAEQAAHWLEGTANVRLHRTIREQPRDRFERDERHVLQPLAARPYRSLILLPRETPAPAVRGTPRVEVERRPLAAYARIAAGGR